LIPPLRADKNHRLSGRDDELVWRAAMTSGLSNSDLWRTERVGKRCQGTALQKKKASSLLRGFLDSWSLITEISFT